MECVCMICSNTNCIWFSRVFTFFQLFHFFLLLFWLKQIQIYVKHVFCNMYEDYVVTFIAYFNTMLNSHLVDLLYYSWKACNCSYSIELCEQSKLQENFIFPCKRWNIRFGICWDALFVPIFKSREIGKVNR